MVPLNVRKKTNVQYIKKKQQQKKEDILSHQETFLNYGLLHEIWKTIRPNLFSSLESNMF